INSKFMPTDDDVIIIIDDDTYNDVIFLGDHDDVTVDVNDDDSVGTKINDKMIDVILEGLRQLA
ncbi:hypothetical protein Tco_0255893, partial [Tanacetum coccineum]